MDDCRKCKDYGRCVTPCSALNKMLAEDEAAEDWRLTYVAEPRAQVDWQDKNIYRVKLVEEKSELSALRPLFNLGNKERLIYMGWHYFGMSIEELSSAFKIKRSRVYDLLHGAKKTLGRI